ncbi:hypothetical protein ACF0H5_017536 [Mactra antiquata]
MAAHMSSSDSSEDEESVAKFREAVISTPSQITTVSTFVKSDVKKKKETVPSKRPDKDILDDNEEHNYNVLGTTPGVRKHISKLLSDAIDRDLKYSDKSEVKSNTVLQQDETNVVKLFSSSSTCLLDKTSTVTDKNIPVRKRPVPSSSDNSSEDERLAEASVSHDFIMKQKDKPYPTNQKPPDIVIKSLDHDKQQNHNSDLTRSVNKSVKCSEHNDDDSSKSAKIENIHNTSTVDDTEVTHTKKAKKKKKKKHKKKKDT